VCADGTLADWIPKRVSDHSSDDLAAARVARCSRPRST
jgi:hypothetical protein